jgi:hypothetical protein
MKYLNTILVSLLISNIVLCDCPQPVTYLNAGQSTPCQGYLFTVTKEKDTRLKLMDYDLTNQELTLKNQYINNLTKQINDMNTIQADQSKQLTLWKNSAENDSERLAKLQDGRGTMDFVIFSSGILGGILACFFGAKAIKAAK